MRKTIKIDLPSENNDTDIVFPCGCRIWYYSLSAPHTTPCASHYGGTSFNRTSAAKHELGMYLSKFKALTGKLYSDITAHEFMLYLDQLMKEEYPAHKEFIEQGKERLKKILDKIP